MDNNYFEALANSIQESENTTPAPAVKATATLTVKVDIDCKLYCDGDFLDLFEANKVKKISIPTGQHLMTIESEHYEDVTEDYVVDVAESGKNYLLLVRDMKQKEEAVAQKIEDARHKAEEEEKHKAEEEARRKKVEEEARRKAEEEARRKAEEEEKEKERQRQEQLKEPYAVLSDYGRNYSLTFYFDNQKAQRGGMDIGPFHADPWSGEGCPRWFRYYKNITKVVFDDTFSHCNRIVSTAYWFCKMEKLDSIQGLNLLNTEKVTNMESMFDGCLSLQKLDLSGFNTEKVKNMENMFKDCISLEELDLSGFNTDNVTNMRAMFQNCSSLKKLDLSGFNTENVTDASYMFYRCPSMKAVRYTMRIGNAKTKRLHIY